MGAGVYVRQWNSVTRLHSNATFHLVSLCLTHRLNMEFDLERLFGLHVYCVLYSFATHPTPRIRAYAVYEGAFG
jgi:hypothetical protein